MTDINARIAKAKGMQEDNFSINGVQMWFDETGTFPLPQYTTDWRLAGELLESMRFTGVSLYYQTMMEKWGIGWRDEYGSHNNIFADTPQMAICLAWLEWSEG